MPPGDIKVEDLWNIIPVNPPVSSVELTLDGVEAVPSGAGEIVRR
ncbi:hypothetical protein [Methanothermobacter wolfeii]|nr:hypothetical protein [Methanothermobacter wolfeii]MDI6701789.1 hypothetical protein [Methanothermobacter wolfeii]MDI6841234.1 hypothetical protein [Methanothermobacter wolfeii]